MALMHCSFFAETLGLCSSMDVIMPERARGQIGMKGTAAASEPACLYLLHGLSDDHTIWQRRTSIERHVAGLNLAVVMPAVNRSWYTDMKYGPRYWTFVSEELPEAVHSIFRISREREKTYVAGLSMGGYGAFKLALRQPERFAAAASLSGGLDIVSRAADATRAPDMDLVFGRDADVKGGQDDLMTLAAAAAARGNAPRLFQCCGTEDFLYAANTRFRDHARACGLDLTYEEGPGSHEWGYWDTNIQRVIAWLGNGIRTP